MAEIRLVWGLFAAAALAVLVTYARLPPADLYHTSEDGLAGGLGRTLVFLNFPTALAAIGVVLACAARLPRRAIAAVVASVFLCLLVVVPGVVDQDDLDAKAVNALPAAGVAVALVLTLRPAARREQRHSAVGDRLRIALAVVLALLAVPWLFAELGFYAPDPILADEVPPGETIAAVHLGHHHGTDGVLLALAALLLSRVWLLGPVASGYAALMLSYGTANAAQDFWLEQVVKRGWTEHGLPSLLRPDLSPGWAALVVAAAAVELLWFRRERRAAVARASAP